MADIFNEIVKRKAEILLQRAKLPKNEIADNLKTIFLNELEAYQYEYDVLGHIVIKDSNGIALTDAHGWALSADEVVKNTFDKYFEISTMPINESEYWQKLRDPSLTREQHKKLTEYWEQRNS